MKTNVPIVASCADGIPVLSKPSNETKNMMQSFCVRANLQNFFALGRVSKNYSAPPAPHVPIHLVEYVRFQ